MYWRMLLRESCYCPTCFSNKILSNDKWRWFWHTAHCEIVSFQRNGKDIVILYIRLVSTKTRVNNVLMNTARCDERFFMQQEYIYIYMTCDCSRENRLCNDKEINFLHKTCVIAFLQLLLEYLKVVWLLLLFLVAFVFYAQHKDNICSNFEDKKKRKKC